MGFKKISLVAVFALIWQATAISALAHPTFQNGDIILQTSLSAQSEAIQDASDSPWSHVAMIFYQNGKAYVYESRGPVGYRSLDDFIVTGLDGKYLVRRLIGGLSADQLSSLESVALSFEGLPYDDAFDWAATDSMYCSKLVWKSYDQSIGVSVGDLQTLGSLDLSSPIVKAALYQRYGDNVPYGETVITPAAIAVSTNLVTVYQK